MNSKYFLLFVLVLQIFINVAFSQINDTMVVRLKTGARIRGIMISVDSTALNFKISGLGEQNISWREIDYLSSSAVYDSLNGTNSFVVLPRSEPQVTWIDHAWSMELLFGSGFQYDRGFGFGARGKLEITNYFTVGGVIMVHVGNDDMNGLLGYSTRNSEMPNYYGHGSLIYWGPEIATTISLGNIILEPFTSMGLATIKKNILYDQSNTTVSKFYVTPGLALKANFGSIKIGLEYRFIILKSLNMSGLYFSIGS